MPKRAVRRLLVGNPLNRRIALYQAALQRLGQPTAEVVAYRDLLLRGDFRFLQRADVLRIESPGEDWWVERELIAAGASPDVADDTAQSDFEITGPFAREMEFDQGRLRFTRQWYRGYRRLLEAIANHAPTGLCFYNRPSDIALMFDKSRCQAKLEEHGAPTPRRFPEVRDFQSLEIAAKDHHCPRIFVKISHGSSASGIAAIHFHDQGVRAVSTVEYELCCGEAKFYNNLRTQTYHHRDQVELLVDKLFQEGAHAEEWLQKATINGRGFDLRVLVVGGQAAHVVIRTSQSPMTNLHLGNRRGDAIAVHEKMGVKAWTQVLDCATQAASLFPHSLYIGVDVMVGPRFRQPYVLEVNAFGDLLPGIQYHGRDTYETEILAEIHARTG